MSGPLRHAFFSQLVRDRRGAAAVEFAIVSSAFIVLLFGLSYVAIILYDKASLQWAVDHASRVAVIDANAGQTEIASAVNDYLSGVGLPTADVAYSVSNSSGYAVAEIQASFQRTYTVPMVTTFSVNLSAITYVPRGS